MQLKGFKKVFEMPMEKLQKRIRDTQILLIIITCFFSVCWLIAFLYANAVDPLVGWMVLTTFFGIEIVILAMSFLFDNLIFFLRKNIEK